jgi:hypothetical protein
MEASRQLNQTKEYVDALEALKHSGES